MPTLPPSTDFTGSSVTQAGAKTFMTTVRTFLADLLGTDSADKAAARAALGAAGLGANSDITSLTALASINGGPIGGLRNPIINGAKLFWQRGVSGSTSGNYQADMFRNSCSGTSPFTFQRSTDVPEGFVYSSQLYATNLTAAQYLRDIHNIESANSAHLAGKKVTVSFYARASEAGQVTVYIGYPTVASDFTGMEYVPTEPPLPILTTWERYSVTCTLVPSAGGHTAAKGLQVLTSYSPTTTGAREVYFTGLFIEEGGVATPFPHLDIGLERSMCQRYYQILDASILGYNQAGNNIGNVISLPVRMRATPTATPNSLANTNAGTTVIDSASVQSIRFYAPVTATGNAQVNCSTHLNASL